MPERRVARSWLVLWRRGSRLLIVAPARPVSCRLSTLLERSSKDKDERITMFVSQLTERLHGDAARELQ